MKVISEGLTMLAMAVALILPMANAAPADAAPRKFKNCTAMHKVYKHGVGLKGAHDHVSSGTPVTSFARRPAVYRVNRGLDRDHDHIACEAH